MRGHLIRIDASDGGGAAAPIFLASVDDHRLCHLDGAQWIPAIQRLPVLSYGFFGGDLRGSIATPSAGFSVTVAEIAGFTGLRFGRARVRVWSGEVGDSFGSFTLRFDGRLTQDPAVAGGIATFEAGPDDAWLDKPLLELFAGTGGVEGPEDLEGSVKPLLLGALRFAPGLLIDAVDNVYRISAVGAIQAVTAVYDRVVSLGASSGDHASLAALLAATIAPGSWATCLALGLVRLGAPADGQVSFDLSGDNAGAGGFVRKPGAIIGRIAALAGGTVDAGNLAALDSARPWNLSLALVGQTTARAVIEELAGTVVAVAGISWTGALFVQPLAFTSPTLTLASDGTALPPVADVSVAPVAAPFWRLATQAEITWVVHDPASVASIDAQSDLSATLSSPIVWVPVDAAGVVDSYAAANTQVVVRAADGTDISADFALETAAGSNPQGLTIDYTGQTAQVTAGLDAGEEQAQVEIKAVGSGAQAGRVFYLPWTVRKSLNDGSSNDRNDLVPDQPGAMGTPENVRLSATGNVTVAATFSIVYSADPTDKNSYDFLELGVWEAATNAAHTMGTDEREVWTLQSTQLATGTYDLLFLLDRAPTSWFTLAVRTVRQVDPDVSPDGSGYIRSPVRQVGPYQPYTQAEIGGITVDDIANAVANFDADNDGNATTPTAATSVTVSGVNYSDASGKTNVGWSYTHSTTAGAANNIDGFLAGLMQRASSAGYPYNPADDGIIRWQIVQPHIRSASFGGTPVDQYCTAIVIPFRNVRADVAASGILKATPAQSSSSTPYRQASSPNFTGTLDGETAANVRGGAQLALVAIDNSGNVATAKVLAGSVAANAISQVDWVAQGFTITLGASETQGITYLGVTSRGKRLLVQMIMDYQVDVSNPNDGDAFAPTVKIMVQRVSTGAKDYSGTATLREVWNAPSASGSKNFGRKTLALEASFDALATGAFNVGWEIQTPSNCGGTFQGYRYIRAEEMGAGE